MNFSQPPPNYVPGLGRGAVGFITRSDIGPANVTKEAPLIGLPATGYTPGVGRGATGIETGSFDGGSQPS